MTYQYLQHIDSPADVKKLKKEELPELCHELRDFIIRELSRNPGHLASSLGTIELTVALHYVFDTPSDKLVWDVGHQAYAHKILTGRRERFSTNRQFKGLAPFPTPAESEYDAFIAGHASNSISAALGIEIAHELQGDRRHVVAIIGDGAMTGGLAFEGLNNASMDKNNLLIILNDNNIAIDPIKGGFTQYLVDITTSAKYNRRRWKLYQWMLRHHWIEEQHTGRLRRLFNSIKTYLTKQETNLFQGLDLRYFGPANGHNVLELVRILEEIKNHQGPKVLHIITKKGKGYEPAEQDQTTWHAPGEFNPDNGERRTANGETTPLWQEVFGQTLLKMAKEDSRIVGITPAMPSGCSMNIMQRELPDRVFDVGIAEGHAVTFSAGLAKEGIVPYCNIYSSFLQRAYDNIIHDVALQNVHVVLCIDRAGIVGNDGATHHGLLDLAYLRPVPNMKIAAPMVADDLRQMMLLAKDMRGPIAIRYPRGRSVEKKLPPVQFGKAVQLREGRDIAILSLGAIGNTVEEVIEELISRKEELKIRRIENKIAHWNMRWLKPIDEEVLDRAAKADTIITIEDGVTEGGLGSAVAEYLSQTDSTAKLVRLGVRDQFVEHGSTKELFHMLHLDKEGICEFLLQELEK